MATDLVSARTVSPDQQQAFSERALSWVVGNLVYFDPTKGALTDDLQLRFKVFIELVYLVNHLLRSSDWQNHGHLEPLKAFLDRVQADYDLTGLVRSEPAGFTALALMEEYYGLTGRSDGRYRRELARLIEAGYTAGMERVPFRRMENRYYLDILGMTGDLPDLRALYYRTPAGLQQWVPTLTRADVYSYTHTIMYLSDMGHRRVDEVVPEAVQHLRWQTAMLLGISIREGDLDLTGELLMCSAALRRNVSVLEYSGWQTLLEHQLSDGAVPHLTSSPEKWQQLAGEDRRREYFNRCYHTTLVGVLAHVYHQLALRAAQQP